MRAQVAAHRRRRRLVEQREPVVDPTALDEGAALPREREHLHVAVADARSRSSNASSNMRHRPRSRSPSANIAASAWDEQQTAVLGGLGQIREQALGIRLPAACDRERAASLVVPCERQRHPRRAESVADGRVRGVRALTAGDRLVELPAPPRGLAVALEVGGSQSMRVSLREGGVRCAPRLPRNGGACLVERVGHLGHGSLIVAATWQVRRR